jgi:hypothetical protein
MPSVLLNILIAFAVLLGLLVFVFLLLRSMEVPIFT